MSAASSLAIGTGAAVAPPRAQSSAPRWASRAFWGIFALVTLLGVLLALGNNLPGHWDAINNLATGRNIAEGRGYVSDVVQQLATPEPLPGRETVRAPGVPYVAAAAFRLFGVSYALPTLIALAVVLLTALCVRQAVRESGGGWLADVAGALVLLSHGTYELRSLWNNGFLALLTAFLLLVLVRHERGRLTGWRMVLACAAVAGGGFLMKQTFMLGALPFGVGLMLTDARHPLRARVAHAGAFVLLFVALTAPYWYTNLVAYGQALYSPIQGLRLPTRYGILPTDRFHRTVRFGEPAYTYATVIAEIGLGELLRREAMHWLILLRAMLAQNPVVVLVGVVGLAFARLRDWRVYAALVALAIPPVFDSSYWIMEPRYLYALFPIFLFLAWLGVRAWREADRERAATSAGRELRRRRFGWMLLAAAVLWPVVPAARQWRWELIASRFPQPSWIEAVRALPAGAVVMAAYPPEVNWYTRRRVVIAPLGDVTDVARVVADYEPEYFLDMEPSVPARRVPFAPEHLALVSAGDDWRLYRIAAPAAAR